MQDSLFAQPRPPEPPMPAIAGVSRVVAYIGRLISQNAKLAGLRVQGEVTEFSRAPSGHVYFSLKENADVLRCIVWSSNVDALPAFKNGDEIVVGGEFGTYPARGTYQLYVNSLEHTGIGKLYAQFEALKEKFRREGLFEAARKRPVPSFPTRIALVTAKGKGAEDFLTTLERRAPHVVVELVETRVQGDGAEIEIADAIDRASRLAVDLIVLTRGGGSYEELFPFNLEPVVRAIVRAKRPVLSAIGHTGDVHVSDLVADRSCETPSNAAQFFGEIRDRYVARVERANERLNRVLRAAWRQDSQRVDALSQTLERLSRNYAEALRSRILRLERRLDSRTPRTQLDERARRLREAASMLNAAAKYVLSPARQRAERLATRLAASDPQAPLARGYAIVTFQGRALRDAAAVRSGDTVEAQLRHGSIRARVEETKSDG